MHDKTSLRSKTPRSIATLGALAAGLLIAGTGLAHAFPGAQYSSQASISPAQARSIAMKAQSGTIKAMELEKESGGSGLRYSFDVKSGSNMHEIGIDARTGKVLENHTEGPNPD